uniref:TWiK family of potassium channels protein 12 n=1 Tax=Lygus hesperus TaxID=30085 RepID=A0A0A9ZB10_LYGHE
MGNLLPIHNYEQTLLQDTHKYSEIVQGFVEMKDCTPVYKTAGIGDGDWRFTTKGKKLGTLIELLYNVVKNHDPSTPFLGTRVYITKDGYRFNQDAASMETVKQP